MCRLKDAVKKKEVIERRKKDQNQKEEIRREVAFQSPFFLIYAGSTPVFRKKQAELMKYRAFSFGV